MKIAAIIGSPRPKGNTTRLLDLVRESLARQASSRGETLDFDAIVLSGRDIRPCRGCRTCFDRGESRCPLDDDLGSIRDRLQAAEAIIVASPVYVNDVSGTMKNWIDRMAFLCHRPAFAGHGVFVLATSGTSPTRRVLSTLATAFSTWGFHIIGRAGFITGALMPDKEMRARYRRKVERIAERIWHSLEHRSALRPSFRSLLTFRIQQMAWQGCHKECYDLDYWREAGWIDRECDFYVPHRANPIKVTLARWTGSVMALFVLRK